MNRTRSVYRGEFLSDLDLLFLRRGVAVDPRLLSRRLEEARLLREARVPGSLQGDLAHPPLSARRAFWRLAAMMVSWLPSAVSSGTKAEGG
jgi:hypothetical protein